VNLSWWERQPWVGFTDLWMGLCSAGLTVRELPGRWQAARSRRLSRRLERTADRAVRKDASTPEVIRYLYERAAARTEQLEDTPWWG
jgi:hypothetical protein